MLSPPKPKELNEKPNAERFCNLLPPPVVADTLGVRVAPFIFASKLDDSICCDIERRSGFLSLNSLKNWLKSVSLLNYFWDPFRLHFCSRLEPFGSPKVVSVHHDMFWPDAPPLFFHRCARHPPADPPARRPVARINEKINPLAIYDQKYGQYMSKMEPKTTKR